jgi:hypothetical protein
VRGNHWPEFSCFGSSDSWFSFTRSNDRATHEEKVDHESREEHEGKTKTADRRLLQELPQGHGIAQERLQPGIANLLDRDESQSDNLGAISVR